MANKMDFKQLKILLSTSYTALGALIIVFILAIVGSILIIDRQFALQHATTLLGNERKIVSALAHLQHEYHLFIDIVQANINDNARASTAFDQQRSLLDEQLQDLHQLYAETDLDPAAQSQLQQYERGWLALQSNVDRWISGAQNQLPASTLLVQLNQSEKLLFNLLVFSERDFSNHIDALHGLINLLNQLLLATGACFAVTTWLTVRRLGQLLTQRQDAATALRASERRQRALLDTIPDAVMRRKRDGTYTDFKAAKEFGRFMPSSDFVGKNVREILPAPIAALSLAASDLALETGEEQNYEYQMNHRQSGILRDYEARVVPSGEDEVQVIIRDITEEKQQEMRFHQAQKLESLGVLAGGIAHDFNNLLTGMLAQNSLARTKLKRGLPALEHVEKAITSAERAADLTRQLLAYAGRGKFQIVAIDLNTLIRENAGLLETALPNRAELQVQLTDQAPLIEADRGQIQQVVMNLVINAAEALGPDGGYVRITTRCGKIENAAEFNGYMAEELAPGNYVVLEVLDNGAGMDETTIKQIFDPFFSTKTHGHGLGLAATLGIIRTHHGGIHVESEPGVGTKFTVLFPLVAAKAIAAITSEPLVAPRYDTKLHVLVIDDETSIREVVADILMSEGIAVLVAAGGEEGIALYQQQQARIGLVLLDMKMPGISGEETFHRLRAFDPTVQVILSSGYTEIEINDYFRSTDIVAFLQKPYDIAQLLQCVHNVLANHDRRTFAGTTHIDRPINKQLAT